MRDGLAERLLAKVMNWSIEDIARERPILEFLATYKYDEYQQFSPGMRFIESLAIWLNQFDTSDERNVAYNFVRKYLIFLSTPEIHALVSSAYPDFIRPKIISEAAKQINTKNYYVNKIVESKEFRVELRRCLFLGLSDGARTDVFRRSNSDISHEQILSFYDVSPVKYLDSKSELASSLRHILGHEPDANIVNFKHVFLIDDFSGSGLSFLRKDGDNFKGKIAKFVKNAIDCENSSISSTACIHIVLYIATEQARRNIESIMFDYFKDRCQTWSLTIIQKLDDSIKVESSYPDFMDLVFNPLYYDESATDKHIGIGGSGAQYGFASCGLPLVLSHNSPNNSVFLLWSDRSSYKVAGLFPRVSRHRKES